MKIPNWLDGLLWRTSRTYRRYIMRQRLQNEWIGSRGGSCQ